MDIVNTEDFFTQNPIDFSFSDNDGNQAIYILDDTHAGKTHHLTLRNVSQKDLVFRDIKPFVISPEENRFHLELRFQAGALDEGRLAWISVQNSGWRLLRVDHPDGEISLYLLFNSSFMLAADDLLMLTFHNVKAGPKDGARENNVVLRYRNVHFQDAPSEDIVGQALETLAIVNERGAKRIPLIVGFIGGHSVLNNSDEDNPNRLTLQFANSLDEKPLRLRGKNSESPTRFTVAFETNNNLADAWGLGTDSEVDSIDLAVEMKGGDLTSWEIIKNSQGKSTQWTLTPLEDLELGKNDYFRVHMPNVLTSLPSGLTAVNIAYRNIPDYRDGSMVREIEKAPILYRDQLEGGAYRGKSFVGIGTNNPQSELDVKGKITGETLAAGTIEADETLKAPVVEASEKVKAPRLEGDHAEAKTAKITESLEAAQVKVTGELLLEGQRGFLIPKGGIIMWSGSLANIPAGWALCDGANGTPDLRSRFIVGAGGQGTRKPTEGRNANGNPIPTFFSTLSAYQVGDADGEEKHQTTAGEMPAHNHHDGTFKFLLKVDGKRTHKDSDDSPTEPNLVETREMRSTGGNQPHENRPPFLALAFIMKL
jgi:microcystin-dependent protein